MSPQQLYKFMGSKFEKIIETNEKLLPKIYTTASKRLNKFEESLIAQQKQKLAKFILKHTGCHTTPQEISHIFEEKNFTYKPVPMDNNPQIYYSYATDKIHKQIMMVKVMKLQPKQQTSNTYEKYYIRGIREDVLHELDLKRFKKDILEVLEAYIAELDKVKIALA